MVESAAGAVLGIGLGFLASRMLSLQWATLIPWALAGLLLGAFSRDRRRALVGGAVYGFVLGCSFMAFGYTGTDPILGKTPFFAIIGVVSAAFGAALTTAGCLVAPRLRRTGGGTG